MKEDIKPSYKEEVLKAVAYHFPDAQVILFGSRATGTAKPGSDIDIAIKTKEFIHPREIVRLKATFENLTIPLMVDVVDLNSIPEELKKRILKEGIVWKK